VKVRFRISTAETCRSAIGQIATRQLRADCVEKLSSAVELNFLRAPGAFGVFRCGGPIDVSGFDQQRTFSTQSAHSGRCRSWLSWLKPDIADRLSAPRQCAVKPPSTGSATPSTKRPQGYGARELPGRSRRTAPVGRFGVSIVPGHTALMRMFPGAYSNPALN